MKIQTLKPMILVLLAVTTVMTCAPAQADSWGNRRSGGRSSGGFWSGSAPDSNRYPTTAEISQSLYGTPPEPYDTQYDHHANDEVPEAVQTG